jgi:hypothetical protein
MRQWSVGMDSAARCPHPGQVIVEVRIGISAPMVPHPERAARGLPCPGLRRPGSHAPPRAIVPLAPALEARPDGHAIWALLARAPCMVPTPAPVEAPVDPQLPHEPRPGRNKADKQGDAGASVAPTAHLLVVTYRISSGSISIRSLG